MSSYHTKQFSHLLTPSAMVLALLLPLESHAGFQWVTPLEETPIAAPQPVEKMPVAPKKDTPAAVQLPALEPAEAAPSVTPPVSVQPVVVPSVSVEPAPQPAPRVAPATVEPPHAASSSEMAPVALTPAIVDHEAAASQANQPVMDVVTPGASVQTVPVQEAKPVEVVPVVAVEEKVVPVPAPQIVEPAPVALPQITTAPAQARPVLASTELGALEPGAKVSGFGKSLPLVVVLKQLLPKDHVFAFEQGVDPAVRVSWQGGKGWRRVLADTLQTVGLTAHEEDKLVSVVRAVPAAASVQEVAVAAPAPSVVPPVTVVEPVAAPEVVAPVEVAPPVVAETTSKPQDAPVALAAVEPVMPPVEPVAVAPVAATDAPVAGKVVMPQATLEPPLLPGASDVWKAAPGEHLRDVIKRWCDRAKVELVWSTEYDYPIQAGVSLTGSFEDAVRDLLSGFVDAKPQPFGRLHDNAAAGQRTLVVQTRGNTNGE